MDFTQFFHTLLGKVALDEFAIEMARSQPYAPFPPSRVHPFPYESPPLFQKAPPPPLPPLPPLPETSELLQSLLYASLHPSLPSLSLPTLLFCPLCGLNCYTASLLERHLGESHGEFTIRQVDTHQHQQQRPLLEKVDSEAGGSHSPPPPPPPTPHRESFLETVIRRELAGGSSSASSSREENDLDSRAGESSLSSEESMELDADLYREIDSQLEDQVTDETQFKQKNALDSPTDSSKQEISETNPKTHHSPRQLLPQLLKAFASQSSQLSSMPSQTKRHPSPTGASQPAEPSPSPESYQRKAPKAPSKHSYACSFCLRTFACDSHWRRHEQTHTKAKPFHCTVCLKGFSDKSYIRVHMEKYCKKMRQSRENGKGVENGMIFQRKSKKSKRHLGSVEVGLDLRLPPNRCSQSFPSVDLQSTNDRPSVIQLAAGPSSTQTSAENSSFSL